MIPENLKRSLDRYKSKVPTDEELTAIFDEINAAKLKGHVQEEVCNYIDKVVHEAEAYQLKAAAEAEAKKLEAERRERSRRIEEQKQIAQQKKIKEGQIELLVFGAAIPLLCFLIICIIDAFSKDVFSWHTVITETSFIAVLFTGVGAFQYLKEKDKDNSIALKYGLVTLLYIVIFCYSAFSSNDEKASKVENLISTTTPDDIKLRTENIFGNNYSVGVETCDDKENHFQFIIHVGNATENGTFYLGMSDNGEIKAAWSTDAPAKMADTFQDEYKNIYLGD